MNFFIVGCSDPLLWYRDEVNQGKIFKVLRRERLSSGDIVWTHEDSEYGRLLNWVWVKDIELVK